MSEPVYPSEAWQRAYMRQIGQQIRDWKRSYYYGQPEVDDQQYDLWWRNLLFLEAKYPHLKDSESPTIGVGAPLDRPRKLTLEEMKAPRKMTLAELQASLR